MLLDTLLSFLSCWLVPEFFFFSLSVDVLVVSLSK